MKSLGDGEEDRVSMTPSLRSELIEPWKAVLIATNYMVIFTIFAIIHYSVDNRVMPIVFNFAKDCNRPSHIQTLTEVASHVGFFAVYIRLIFHMVVAFYPSLDFSLRQPSGDK